MMSLRRFAFPAVLAMVGLWLALPLAKASVSDAAGRYIQGIGDQALTVIADTHLSRDKKQTALEKIFITNVDFAWIGRFVMGQAWRHASDDQKTRYLKEYKKFLTLHYTSRFSDLSGGTFKVVGVRDEGDDEYTVAMQLQSADANSEPVLVDYRVRKAEKDGFKIFDVIVEGVSLITTQRSEFASVINKGGIDYLIEMLTIKSDTGDVGAGQPGIAAGK